MEDNSGYYLCPIKIEDAELIRQWRNAQISLLRQQTPITAEEQKKYFKELVSALFDQEQPKQLLFSFLHDGKSIGYGGLTNIDWFSKRGEVSFLVDPKRAADVVCYTNDFTHFLMLLGHLFFYDLDFHRLFTETFSFRKQHMQILESCGFKKEGVLRDHIFKDGKWHDSIMHGLLKGDFQNA